MKNIYFTGKNKNNREIQKKSEESFAEKWKKAILILNK